MCEMVNRSTHHLGRRYGLTVYFVRNSLDRGALMSFLLTLEGAEK